MLSQEQRSFSFGRYNLLPFTDTNSVICKIIVGNGKRLLLEEKLSAELTDEVE